MPQQPMAGMGGDTGLSFAGSPVQLQHPLLGRCFCCPRTQQLLGTASWCGAHPTGHCEGLAWAVSPAKPGCDTAPVTQLQTPSQWVIPLLWPLQPGLGRALEGTQPLLLPPVLGSSCKHSSDMVTPGQSHHSTESPHGTLLLHARLLERDSSGQTDRQTDSLGHGPCQQRAGPEPLSPFSPAFPVPAEFSSQHRHTVLYLGFHFSFPESGALEVPWVLLPPCFTPLPCWSQPCLPLPCYLTKTRLQNKPASRSYEQVFIC